MKCLGIPVDHRLRRIIKNSPDPKLGVERSDHIDILHELGSTTERKDEIATGELNHLLELASPETQGGVLPVLLRPPRNQTYDHGFTADVEACRTTDAVRELISVATNTNLSLDDVSVFDRFPFAPEDCDDEGFLKISEEAFCRAVEAKKPDVVICCYQGEKGNEPLVKALRSLGVGKVFSNPQPELQTSWPLRRVNAFHPSYAVNYNRTYSCFRRLLLLEFVHAFSIWQGCWREESWMKELRSECERKASELGSRSHILMVVHKVLTARQKNIIKKERRTPPRTSFNDLRDDGKPS